MSINQFPYQIQDVDLQSESIRHGPGDANVQVGEEKWFFPQHYRDDAEFYYNFQSRPEDIWIITFPRSGTTLTCELVWLLANDLDFETAAKIPLEERVPFFEVSLLFRPGFLDRYPEHEKRRPFVDPGWKTLKDISGRRIIKTHLPLQLLPPNLLEIGCKIIYVGRNPKDVAVSYYNLEALKKRPGFTGEFPEYWESFVKGQQMWAPYWPHILKGWQLRHEKNVLFLFYENLNKDMRNCVEKTANFLNRSYPKNRLDSLMEHLKIDNFRKNPSVSLTIFNKLGIFKNVEYGFIGRGKSGGWRDYFDEELNEKADRWIEDNLKDTDLKFPPY